MTETFKFDKAQRTASPVSVFIQGVSGSGKTYSALLLARGLAGDAPIGIIDTEGGRAKIYADDPGIGGFHHLPFRAPFSPDRFIAALDAAVAAGLRAVIIDSMSLEHDGEGGLLDMADAEEEAILAKNPNNRASAQQKWTKPKLAHKRLLNHIAGLPIHVIACFRETLTTDFNATDERGNKKPATVLTVVAEKNTLFSFEIHAKIDADHRATWTRVPEPYRPAIRQGEPVTVDTGHRLAQLSGAGVAPVAAQPVQQSPGREQHLRDIAAWIAEHHLYEADFDAKLEAAYGGKFKSFRDLPDSHLAKLNSPAKLAKIIQ